VLAEGEVNAPGWIAAEVDLNALRRLREEGEMRNWLDWPLQPGAQALEALVEVVDLR
jgi:hypothetical protein